jgi:hypothetical protein
MSTNEKKKKRAPLLTWGAWCVATLGLAAVVVACEGGKAGDKCTTNNDCNSSLTCQPIEGRNADYCCGAYGPETQGENIPENCQPLDAGTGGSGSGSSSGSGSGTGSSPPPEDAAAGG